MKRILTFAVTFFTFLNSFANNKDSLIYYPVPDSVKAVSFLVDISVGDINTKKEVFAGIKTDVVKLSLESDKKEREIVFEFPSDAAVMANTPGVKIEKGEVSWKYNWEVNKEYRLLIATASDSAGNFALYSGYIFLPNEKKWKLIGTCKISGQWNTIKQPAVFYSGVKKNPLLIGIDEVWCQRNNGSWKNLAQKTLASPVVNLFAHVDSLTQLEIERIFITNAIAENKTDAKNVHDGVYYAILKEGTGRQVSVNDTVTVFYKGYLLKGNSLFRKPKYC